MDKGSRKTDEETSNSLQELESTFKDVLNTFISKRERTIQLLKDKVKMLNSCRKKGNISKITGAGVCIAGTIATVASVPLTGGISLVAIVVSGILGVSSGVAGIGGGVYVSFREKKLMAETLQILDDDSIEASNLEESALALQAHVEYMSQLGISLESALNKRHISAVTLKAARYAKGGLTIATKLPKLGQLARLGQFTKLVNIAKTASVLTAVVFIPLEIIQIVSSSSELKKGNSEKASIVQKAIKTLERDLVKMKELAFIITTNVIIINGNLIEEETTL